MSYILDALLKADQERQRNAMPTLNSVHAAQIVEQPSTPKRWLYLVLRVLLSCGLLAAGLLLGMWPSVLTPDLSANVRAAAKPGAVTLPPAPTLAPLAKNMATGAAQPGPESVSHQAAPLPAATVEDSTSPTAVSIPLMVPRATHPPATAVVTQPADTPPATNPNRSNRVIEIGELPPALRKEVDNAVTISGFSFSADNNERMAIINDRARRAGDEVIAGMKLETIGLDGIVLNYKGYRFRTGMY